LSPSNVQMPIKFLSGRYLVVYCHRFGASLQILWLFGTISTLAGSYQFLTRNSRSGIVFLIICLFTAHEHHGHRCSATDGYDGDEHPCIRFFPIVFVF
jgi:hypothetical protein